MNNKKFKSIKKAKKFKKNNNKQIKLNFNFIKN